MEDVFEGNKAKNEQIMITELTTEVNQNYLQTYAAKSWYKMINQTESVFPFVRPKYGQPQLGRIKCLWIGYLNCKRPGILTFMDMPTYS